MKISNFFRASLYLEKFPIVYQEMKTFIRRPGNKSKHLKHIIPHIPEFTGTYYEPFLGTGAVYLHLLPEKAVLNDLNKDIVNIWKLVKSDPAYMIEEIDKFKKNFLPKTNEMKLKQCKEIVSKIDKLKGKERTIHYLLMIYCSFNGCLINNNKYHIGGLYGAFFIRKSVVIFTEDYQKKLLELKQLLKNVKIENKDYSKIIEKTKKGDFVFLDPPYIEEKQYSFRYNKNEDFDPVVLKKELHELDSKNVKWMMTQIDTPQVRKLFKNYKFRSYTNTSNFNISTTVKKELIITNY